MVYAGLITVGYSEMALQVKLVQKVGQISLSTGVTNHLKEGWQPYGSPYVAYDAAAQVMFLPDDAVPAPDAEYQLVSKYGLVTVAEQVIEKLTDGWNMFGEPFTTQYGPTHAMTKGEFTIFMPNLGFGEGGGSGGGSGLTEAEVQALIDTAIAAIELPEEDQWKAYVDKGDTDTLQQAGETAINAVNDLRTVMDHNDQVVLDGAKAYTDEAILALPGQPDWQTNIDKGDQETLAAAQTYVDDQIAGIPPPPMYDWQVEIDLGDGETLNSAKNYTDDTATETLTQAAGHADTGDTAVLEAANAFTTEAINSIPAPKDWAEEIEAGDGVIKQLVIDNGNDVLDAASKYAENHTAAAVSDAAVESTKLLNDTMEAGLFGAKERWEADDKRDRDYVTLGHLSGGFTSELNDGLSPVTMQVNDNGTSRTTYSLRPASEYPDGFVKYVYNSTGSETSEEWASSIRVHMPQVDYDAGFMMRGPMGALDFSAVIKPNGFGVFILDKAKKMWFFSGVNIVKNSSKVPTSRIPAGDLPEE